MAPTDFVMHSSAMAVLQQVFSVGHPLLDALLAMMTLGIVLSAQQYIPLWISDVKVWITLILRRIMAPFYRRYNVQVSHVKLLGSHWDQYVNTEGEENLHLVRALEEVFAARHNLFSRVLVLPKSSEAFSGVKPWTSEYERLQDMEIRYANMDENFYMDDIHVKYARLIQQAQDGKSSRIFTDITLSTSISSQILHEFIASAYDEYVKRHYALEKADKRQYFFTLSAAVHGGAKEHSGTLHWKRYPFISTRSFDSLFFDAKTKVLQLVDDFESRRGLFNPKRDAPHRLTLLLHGRPGTGKTSFIKALARKTRRHLVYPALPLVKTNADLLDAFFNLKLKCDDNGAMTTYYIPMDQRIYVLEDIDAISDIVKARKQKSSKSSSPIFKKDESDSSLDTLGPAAIMKSTTADDCPQPDLNKWHKYYAEADELNLSGILNVLDGLLELSGAIIIITSNHPETLDPALTRPGRITMQLHMDLMSPTSICHMIDYYFPDHAPPKPSLVSHLQLTPAQLENLYLCHRDYDKFMEQLQSMK